MTDLGTEKLDFIGSFTTSVLLSDIEVAVVNRSGAEVATKQEFKQVNDAIDIAMKDFDKFIKLLRYL